MLNNNCTTRGDQNRRRTQQQWVDRSGRPAGFTVLEVTVALGIAGLLLALLIPAVQQGRESARRVQCASNLRQILMALQDYESAYGHFPRRKFHSALLAQLGLNADSTKTAIYACPSDPESIGQWKRNRQSYLMNAGIVTRDADGFAAPAGSPEIGSARFRDGLSNTAAVAERLAWPSIAGQVVYWDDYPQWWNRRVRDTAVKHADIDEFADECEHRALKPLTTWVSIRSYNHILPPNRNSCVNATITDELKAVTTSSFHTGGVNLSLGDGSTRFVSDDIDLTVWRALATRSGREVVDSF